MGEGPERRQNCTEVRRREKKEKNVRTEQGGLKVLTVIIRRRVGQASVRRGYLKMTYLKEVRE